jgi:prepilin-type N-terminal cleavage/methylation domain-containing protein
MKRNGFTLIELLAAIIILAIIVAIAVPIVLNIIEGTRVNAFKVGANQILKAIENKYVSMEEYDPSIITVENMESEIGISNENYNLLEVSIDDDGKISIFLEGKDKWDGLVIRGTKNNLVDVPIESSVLTYDYTGDYQTFTVPYSGIYKIQLWGAAGGGTLDQAAPSHAGLGGFTEGQIYLSAGEKIYIYVGGKGGYGGPGSAIGGYNGGGNGGSSTAYSGAGGGATDIRLVSGTWNNQESLYSRLMVAAGGGGADNAGGTFAGDDDGSGGSAGGLIGQNAKISGGYAANTGGTQTLGTLGKGAAAAVETDTGGAGSGYRGGFATNNNNGGAGGGSSFISGYPGCDAIDQAGINTGQSVHYSNRKFTNYRMIDGLSLMPSTSGSSERGHSGNGYAIISGPVSKDVYTYSSTGTAQTFVVPKTGNYQIELWGASGGGTEDQTVGSHKGFGGYTKGNILLSSGETLYVYVGGEGLYFRAETAKGGYNGGGNGGYLVDGCGAGGGATDIRLVGGNWDSQESLYSRIMVAAGGGGADNAGAALGATDDGSGGYGGGLIGENARINGAYAANTGGTQTLGTLGVGGSTTVTTDTGGGGGGYRGGFATSNGQGGAGGGSSFISGFTGCDAVNASGTNTGSPVHFSGKIFTNASMLTGNQTIPTPSGGTSTGHSGSGYIKITYLP